MTNATIWMLAAASATILLAGCGKEEPTDEPTGSADAAKDAAKDNTVMGNHGHEETSLGTTTVGDLTIECWQGHGQTAAGKEMHLVVKLPHNDAGQSAVRAWIGTEDRLQSLVAKGTYAPAHDDYDVHVEAPTPLPDDAAWWIEVELPDGTTHLGSIAFR